LGTENGKTEMRKNSTHAPNSCHKGKCHKGMWDVGCSRNADPLPAEMADLGGDCVTGVGSSENHPPPSLWAKFISLAGGCQSK